MSVKGTLELCTTFDSPNKLQLGLVHMESKKCPNPTNSIQIWLKTHHFDSILWARGTLLTPCEQALMAKKTSYSFELIARGRILFFFK